MPKVPSSHSVSIMLNRYSARLAAKPRPSYDEEAHDYLVQLRLEFAERSEELLNTQKREAELDAEISCLLANYKMAFTQNLAAQQAYATSLRNFKEEALWAAPKSAEFEAHRVAKRAAAELSKQMITWRDRLTAAQDEKSKNYFTIQYSNALPYLQKRLKEEEEKLKPKVQQRDEEETHVIFCGLSDMPRMEPVATAAPVAVAETTLPGAI